MATQLSRKEQEKLLERIKDRYDTMYDSDQENRREALDDLKFVNVPGYQWDDNMKQERGQRPCYEFNKLRISGKRIINDMRANRPQGKVRAVEGGDKKVAEINEGLIRNIWNVSDGDTVIDNAAEYQVNAGFAAWRVTTEYCDDGAFDQDIVIKPIKNPFTLYCDPASNDFLKRDAEDWLLTEKVTFKSYEAKYGKDTEKSDFQDSIEFDDDENWQDEERVRIAEYWWKEPYKKELWMMQFPLEDGGVENKVVDSESDEADAIRQDPEMMARIVRTREVMADRIMWCVVSGSKVLEGPTEFAGKEFPFIMIYGESIFVDGRPYWWGLPRFAKDAQRSYNIARTAISEAIAQNPKSPFWATQEQAKGLQNQWAEAHKKNLPFMLYNPDPKSPGPPVRMGSAAVPVALMQESQIASDEIKAVTGIFDDSLGNKTDSQSGRAIYARQQQGEIATFNYQDNMAKGIRRTYEIILGLIPEIYDTERELRVLGSDGAEDYVKVNQTVMDYQTNKRIRINDLSTGKYDVTITVGPNFSTQRQEAAETYGQLSQQFPELMAAAGDLVFKSMDLPYAEEIADRLKTLLPPPIQKMLTEGNDIPPEAQQMMMQAEQAMAQVQEYGRLVQEAASELQEDQSLNKQEKAEINTALAQLKQAEAEFDAKIAKAMADLTSKEAGLTKVEANVIVKDADVAKRSAEVSVREAQMESNQEPLDAVQKVDEILAGFMQAADAAIDEIKNKPARRAIGGETRREGGKLTAVVNYDDGSSERIAAVRDKDGLKIVPDSEG